MTLSPFENSATPEEGLLDYRQSLSPCRLPCMKSAFYLYIRQKAVNVTKTVEEKCDCFGKLKLTASKLPAEDSGTQSGESPRPFTLPTPP